MEGRNLLSSGRYEEAEGVFFQGRDCESTFVIRCLAQAMLGKTDGARRTHEILVALFPGTRLAWYPKTIGMVAENDSATLLEAVARLDGLNR